MGYVNSWVLQICICAVAVVICENLLPDGHIRKTVYFVLGLVVLMCFVSPLKSFSTQDFSVQTEIPDTCDSVDWFNRVTEEKFRSNVTALIEECLGELDVAPRNIELYMDTDEDNCISITKVRITINEDDREKIDAIVSSLYRNLGLDADVTVRN